MPLPQRRKGERVANFISRCMRNPIAVKDFPKSGQRFAVCQSQSKKR